MNLHVSKPLSLVLALACAACLSLTVAAQDATKSTAKAAAADSPSRWDIFAGYSYLAPKGSVNGFNYKAVNYGVVGSVSRYFNKYVGVQGEGDVHNDANETTPNDDFAGGSGGMIFRYPTADITPFAHALVGAESVGSYAQTNKWGLVLTAGGGMDYETPLFDHHLAIRIFQADYQYTHEDWGMAQRGNFNMVRLSTGLVYHIGSIAPPPPVTLACSASPNSIFPGDPVTVTATAGSLDPKLNALYSITGVGVSGTGATATVATGALAPGSYTVKCGVKEGKPGKEGLKPWQVADASASFTVKAFEPPTISCSANPSTIKPGERVLGAFEALTVKLAPEALATCQGLRPSLPGLPSLSTEQLDRVAARSQCAGGHCGRFDGTPNANTRDGVEGVQLAGTRRRRGRRDRVAGGRWSSGWRNRPVPPAEEGGDRSNVVDQAGAQTRRIEIAALRHAPIFMGVLIVRLEDADGQMVVEQRGLVIHASARAVSTSPMTLWA